MINGWIQSIVLLLAFQIYQKIKDYRVCMVNPCEVVHGKGALYLTVSQIPNQTVRSRVRVIDYANLAFVSCSTWDNINRQPAS